MEKGLSHSWAERKRYYKIFRGWNLEKKLKIGI